MRGIACAALLAVSCGPPVPRPEPMTAPCKSWEPGDVLRVWPEAFTDQVRPFGGRLLASSSTGAGGIKTRWVDWDGGVSPIATIAPLPVGGSTSGLFGSGPNGVLAGTWSNAGVVVMKEVRLNGDVVSRFDGVVPDAEPYTVDELGGTLLASVYADGGVDAVDLDTGARSSLGERAVAETFVLGDEVLLVRTDDVDYWLSSLDASRGRTRPDIALPYARGGLPSLFAPCRGDVLTGGRTGPTAGGLWLALADRDGNVKLPPTVLTTQSDDYPTGALCMEDRILVALTRYGSDHNAHSDALYLEVAYDGALLGDPARLEVSPGNKSLWPHLVLQADGPAAVWTRWADDGHGPTPPGDFGASRLRCRER